MNGVESRSIQVLGHLSSNRREGRREGRRDRGRGTHIGHQKAGTKRADYLNVVDILTTDQSQAVTMVHRRRLQALLLTTGDIFLMNLDSEADLDPMSVVSAGWLWETDDGAMEINRCLSI